MLRYTQQRMIVNTDYALVLHFSCMCVCVRITVYNYTMGICTYARERVPQIYFRIIPHAKQQTPTAADVN